MQTLAVVLLIVLLMVALYVAARVNRLGRSIARLETAVGVLNGHVLERQASPARPRFRTHNEAADARRAAKEHKTS